MDNFTVDQLIGLIYKQDNLEAFFGKGSNDYLKCQIIAALIKEGHIYGEKSKIGVRVDGTRPDIKKILVKSLKEYSFRRVEIQSYYCVKADNVSIFVFPTADKININDRLGFGKMLEIVFNFHPDAVADLNQEQIKSQGIAGRLVDWLSIVHAFKPETIPEAIVEPHANFDNNFRPLG